MVVHFVSGLDCKGSQCCIECVNTTVHFSEFIPMKKPPFIEALDSKSKKEQAIQSSVQATGGRYPSKPHPRVTSTVITIIDGS